MHLAIRTLGRGQNIHPCGPGLPLSRLPIVEWSWEGLASEAVHGCVSWSLITSQRQTKMIWADQHFAQVRENWLSYTSSCSIRNGLKHADTEIFGVTFPLRTHRCSWVWVLSVICAMSQPVPATSLTGLSVIFHSPSSCPCFLGIEKNEGHKVLFLSCSFFNVFHGD